jgi:hypothetical protein
LQPEVCADLKSFNGPRRRVPNRDCKEQVQQASNTAAESVFVLSTDLDKITDSQHADGAPKIYRQGVTGPAMKIVTGILAAVLFMSGIGASHAVIRISEDRGGRIGTYVDRYQGLRGSGETVVIDGLCASACTIVLGAVPHEKICVTSRATLGFHAAWDFGAGGRPVTNLEATRMLYEMYPSSIRSWISRRGGLKQRMIFLRGRELTNMYRPCYMDAQASAHAR